MNRLGPFRASTDQKPIQTKPQIIATLGPSSQTPKMLENFIQEGVQHFRFNLGQGSHESHHTLLQKLRSLFQQLPQKPSLSWMADLQGPFSSVGLLAHPPMVLTQGKQVKLIPSITTHEADSIPCTDSELVSALAPGQRVLLNEGQIVLEVLASTKSHVYCQIVTGGILNNQASIHVPDTPLPCNLTEKDKTDLTFALKEGASWIILSGVQSEQEIQEAKTLIQRQGKQAQVMAKIERPQATTPIMLEKIAAQADGLIVARGDLGIEIGLLDLPGIQQRIIKAAQTHHKPVIVANHLLPSMVNNSSPTRSEVGELAYLLQQGVQGFLLTQETATGKNPLEAIKTLQGLIQKYPPTEITPPAGVWQKIRQGWKKFFSR